MGGRASRQKGIRNELKFRDEAIKAGYEARRIPLSGSQAGFKGDVVFEDSGKPYKAEVKSRAKTFTSLYLMLGNPKPAATGFILEKDPLGMIAVVGYSLRDVMGYSGSFFSKPTDKVWARGIRKINSLYKLLGESDVLAVKDDGKPFIYIRYMK